MRSSKPIWLSPEPLWLSPEPLWLSLEPLWLSLKPLWLSPEPKRTITQAPSAVQSPLKYLAEDSATTSFPPTGWNQTQIVDLDDSDDDQDFNESDAQSIDDDDVIDVETLDRDLHVKPTVSNGRLFAGKCYMRKEIRSLLGVIFMYQSKNVVRGRRLGVRNFASFPVMFHPRIPAVPGADGEVFLGLTYEATLGTKGGRKISLRFFQAERLGHLDLVFGNIWAPIASRDCLH
ncbi:hypothetical protein BS47DRAFT_1361651 [Hydnum rufescens UP504]|uniref:Uncharacterized protein n=1 Tax=Hydnum rufescens UP504 TaxID=1448309 RepID=A0A9P6DTL5_9AGAM|nr:hypothetical protein BS47DRAFT_1361651 [Hydnum rufescens UP504]